MSWKIFGGLQTDIPIWKRCESRVEWSGIRTRLWCGLTGIDYYGTLLIEIIWKFQAGPRWSPEFSEEVSAKLLVLGMITLLHRRTLGTGCTGLVVSSSLEQLVILGAKFSTPSRMCRPDYVRFQCEWDTWIDEYKGLYESYCPCSLPSYPRAAWKMILQWYIGLCHKELKLAHSNLTKSNL